MIADLDALLARSEQHAAIRGPAEGLDELESACSAAYIAAWLAAEIAARGRFPNALTPSEKVRTSARARARARVGRVTFANSDEHRDAIADCYLRGTLDQAAGDPGGGLL